MPTHLSNQDNPDLIYQGSGTSTPLFLLHDGGGTTYSYHCLEPLGNRTVYGIHNAHFDDGGFWTGGIAGMAAYYVELIIKTLPSPPLHTSGKEQELLLGGWSLGGILSLDIAHQLATRADLKGKYKVLGMVWIDTVFPRWVEGKGEGETGSHAVVVGPNELIEKTQEELDAMKPPEKAKLNMWHARRMMRDWELPGWGRASGDGDGGGDRLKPPPTILLRAKERGKGDGHAFVDRTRQLRLLGWEGYNDEHGGFICDVVDVEGGHFDLFAFDKLEVISKQIETAVDDLEKGARSGTV